MTYTQLKLPPRSRVAQWANRNGTSSVQAEPCSSCENIPVQRPLARRQVVLSCQVSAYYGLIRHSRSLRSTYALIRAVFARRSCQGWYRELPQFNPRDFPYVPPSVPRWTGWPLVIVASPSVVAFAQLVEARRPQSTHAGSRVVASRGCKVRLMLRPAGMLVLLRQGRLHSSFHLPGSPPKKCRIWLHSQTINDYDRTFTGKSRSLMGCKLIDTNRGSRADPSRSDGIRCCLGLAKISAD